jgi:chromosome segregation protein
VTNVRARIAKFLSGSSANANDVAAEVANLKQEAEKLKQAQTELVKEEERVQTNLAQIKKDLEQKKTASQGAVRELYELRARRTEARSLLEALKAQEEKLRVEELDLKQEVEEGEVLVDREIRTFINAEAGAKLGAEDRTAQEKRRKDLERLKIRLEDMGVESTDVLNEYKQANERDEFLATELLDLEAAKISLVQVITELKEKLETEFTGGLKKINEEFTNYFSLMFGGGSARLDLLVPEKKKKKSDLEIEEMPEDLELEDTRPGIDIAVNLPRKKIRGLQMLSGGERALTSIALLFAIASVNPPPFLILDETDAALDEANSRKYGEMIATLAKSSQLILITHNRETMGRAGVLYGVTMGSEGVSKILSVRFEEAQSFAK